MEIDIERGDRTWRIDLSNLIRTIDCAEQYSDGVRVCPADPQAPCPNCPRRSNMVGWDLPHEKLYFGIGTGASQNHPWTIFSYNLVTRKVTRFTNTFAASVDDGVVSSSGRYLAYISYGHVGMCFDSSAIEVIDLWTRRLANPKIASESPNDATLIKHLNWALPSVLEYEASAHDMGSCRDGKMVERPLTGTIDMGALFH